MEKSNEEFQVTVEGEGEVVVPVALRLLMAVVGKVILVTDSTCSPLAKPA